MKKTFGVLVVVGLVLSFSLVTGAPVVADPGTITVGDGKDYATIAAAVNAASEGDTIHVYPGNYTETLVIEQPNLTLQAVDEDGDVIDARDYLDTPLVIIDGGGAAGVGTNGAVVRIVADGVRLEGFAVQNGGTAFDGDDVVGNAGIGILSRSQCVITRNLVQDSAFGVAVMASAAGDANENIISENVICDNVYTDGDDIVTDEGGVHTGQGIRIDSLDGFGEATGNSIENNRISGSVDGIYLAEAAAETIVTGNEIFENYHRGVHIYKSDGNVFTGNYIFNNGIIGLLEGDVTETQNARNSAGVRISGGTDNTFTGNEVYNEVETSGRQVKGFRLFDTGAAEPTSPTGNVINYNGIYGHTEGTFQYGIDNRGYHHPPEPPDVDARWNWWGHETGPDHDLNLGGQGDRVSNNVLFSPWLYKPQEQFVSDAPCYAGSVVLANEATEVIENGASSYYGGWNSFSTPVTLHTTANMVSQLLALTAGSDLFIERAQRFDPAIQEWVPIIMGNAMTSPDYQIKPGEGFFIQVRSAGSIPILVRTNATSPSSRDLVYDWNLVGLSSLGAETVQTALSGVPYSVVQSPKPPNTEAWSVPPAEAGEKYLRLGEAYWVGMPEPGILFGFIATPVEDDMTWELNQ